MNAVEHNIGGSPKDGNAPDVTRKANLVIWAYFFGFGLGLYLFISVVNIYFRVETDKEAYLNLSSIVSQLDDVVQDLRPDLVLSPAYEGGHPDHDSAAFAAASVRRKRDFEHREFPLYHADTAARMVAGNFIEESSCETEVLELSPPEQTLKRKMFACFRTQREILANFAVDKERFRQAPRYDFTKAPHPGPLLYEGWGWGIEGAAWRQSAQETLGAFEHTFKIREP